MLEGEHMLAKWKWLTRIVAATLVVCVMSANPCWGQPTEPRFTELPAEASGGQLIAASGSTGGLVVHLGSGDARHFAQTTAALKMDQRFVVHGLYHGPENFDAVRRELRDLTDDGSVTVESWSGARLPYAERLVNLIVVSDRCQLPPEELDRVLAPGGILLTCEGDHYSRIAKPRPEAIDDWTHLLYDAANNAVSSDSVVGPPHHLQWIAPPLNARHHERLGTVTATVSAGGRLFYIIDESPTASILLPPRWALVARDAFSGIVLWKRAIPRWEDHLRGFRSGPPELSRSLVATGQHVYVTLGQRAQVSALDPATGDTLLEYPETDGTEEILLEDGVLYLAMRYADDDAQGSRGLTAVDARTGNVLWQQAEAEPLPMSLAMAAEQVFYMTLQAVVCLDAGSGKQIWSTPREVARNRPGWSSPTVVIHDGVLLVADRWTEYKDEIDEITGKPVARWLAQEGWTGDLIAYSAETGAELWQCPCAETYHAPPDVFVADGLVWVGQSRSRTGPDFVAGRDPYSGEIKRQLQTDQAWDTTMPHHRCHRNRATQQYIIAGRTGVEFIDLETGQAQRHHWTRGTCQFGTLPANGLLYVPSHSCACYIEAKLTGFLAMAPRGARATGNQQQPTPDGRTQTGPVFAEIMAEQPRTDDSQPASVQWPTYRHDSLRSGYTPQKIPAELGSLWEADLGGRISSPVIANRMVFVATVDTHRVHALDVATGRPNWAFTAGGRIDSPPTVAGGRVIFGAADGYVYCLRAADGQLAWRFQAAPEERRIMAFGQLESAWPVHGSVLVLGNAVYCVAGRSSYLDGGMTLYRLELETGNVLAQGPIYSRDPETGQQPDEPIMFEMPGAMPDVLASDGEAVYMRHLAFDSATLEPRPPTKHVYSPAGFLSDNWWHRNYWIDGTHFYSGYIGWYFAGREAPAGRLLAFTDDKLYGYGYAPSYYRGSTGRKYNLFGLDRAAQPQQPAADYRRANRDYPHSGSGKFNISYQWSRQVPLLVRSMVLTEDKLFAAGPPENALTRQSVFAGETGGRLTVVSTANGEPLKDYQLDALPVFDGMAAAYGRLFLSLKDGRLLCLGAGGEQTSTLSVVKPLDERLPPLEAVEEPGLAGYWKFDEAEGNLARDSSGGGHTGEATDNWVTGLFGNCIRADGPAAVTIPDGPCLHVGTGDFTIAIWMSPERHDCRILGKEAFPRNWWVINVLPDGRTELVLGHGTGPGKQVRPTSQTPLALNAWTQLVYVVDRANQVVSCYLNGQLEGTTEIPDGLSDAPFDVEGIDLRIPTSHKPFHGLLDELKIYHRSLSGEEIGKSYDAEKGNRTSVAWE